MDLNDGERKLVDTRFEIGNALQETLEEVLTKLDAYQDYPTISKKNKLVGAVTNIIRQCLPENEYSALCATVRNYSADVKLQGLADVSIYSGFWQF